MSRPLHPNPPRYSKRPLPARGTASARADRGTSAPSTPGVRNAAVRFGPATWDRCEGYLYGVDLFNAGFWFECHEAWEEVWIAAGRSTGSGRFLRGLIQLAAAHLHRERGNAPGADRLSGRAFARLSGAGDARFGVDVSLLVAQSRAFFEGRRSEPARIRLRLP